MSETNLMNSIMLSLNGKCRIWRNNTGAIKDSTGRLVRFGLCKGSADLVGLTSIVVTPEMVGKKLAVFTAIEVKTATGKATPEQLNFIKRVQELGGLAGIARSIEDAKTITEL